MGLATAAGTGDSILARSVYDRCLAIIAPIDHMGRDLDGFAAALRTHLAIRGAIAFDAVHCLDAPLRL